jgi:hypothetical protein
MLQHNQTGANFMNLIFTVTDVVCLTGQNFQARLILAGEVRGALAMVHPLVRICKVPHLPNKPPEKNLKEQTLQLTLLQSVTKKSFITDTRSQCLKLSYECNLQPQYKA